MSFTRAPAPLAPLGRLVDDARRTGVVALALLLAAAGVLLLYAGRHLTFYYDEWSFVVTRRVGGLHTYLDPHNGHFSLFPVLVYKLLFAIVGLRHYWPYRLIAVALHLLCAALLYVILRRRVGPVWALLPTCLLLFMGSAWADLLWPFQIGYFGSVAGGLCALATLDARGERRRPALAAAGLTLSIASSGVGLAFLAAALVLLILQRAPWRLYWVVAAPALVYLAWYVGWGGGEQTRSDAVLGTPDYVASAAAGAVAGISGLNVATWGAPLAVALVAGLVMAWPRSAPPTPMLVAGVTGVLVFWVLAGIVRSGNAEPQASRYLYIGAVFIYLVVAEAGLGTRLPVAWLPLGAVLVVGALVANLGDLRAGERDLRTISTGVRADLTAVQIAAPVVPAGFAPDPSYVPQLTAGSYLAAEHDLGSPAPGVTGLQREPESFRERADAVLAQAEASAPNSGLGPAGLHVDALYGARTVPRGACLQVTPTAALGSLDLTLPAGTALVVKAPAGATAMIYLRRFGSAFTPPAFATLAAGAQSRYGFPRDLAPDVPWHLQAVAGARFAVCGGGAA